MEKPKKKLLTEKEAGKALDRIYSLTMDGIPKISASVDELAENYLTKNVSAEKAATSLVRTQILKCGTSGFVTNLGGFITLPVAIPANISSVLYVQMRMIAAIAKIGGYDIKSDQVQTMVYACLVGKAASDILKKVGIDVGQKGLNAAIDKIPGKVLTAINRKIGFRLLTKFGEKGSINLCKLIPVAGGAIGAGFDAVSTKIIAANAIKMFLCGDSAKEIVILDYFEAKEDESESVEEII